MESTLMLCAHVNIISRTYDGLSFGVSQERKTEQRKMKKKKTETKKNAAIQQTNKKINKLVDAAILLK